MIAGGTLVAGALLVATVGIAPASADTTTVSTEGGLLAALHPGFAPGTPYFVHLGGDINTTDIGSIDVNTDVFLDLNGHSLTAANITADGVTLHILDAVGGGSLTASAGDGQAGISANSGSEVEIASGTVVANGGSGGAGIGSDNSTAPGTVVILGGNVTATGGQQGSGVGGGAAEGAGIVQISGGTVSATGGLGAAGIGSGWFDSVPDASPGTISINGGVVTAVGGQDGAGIGGGGSGAAGDITIGAGATVTASTNAIDNDITPAIGGGSGALGYASLEIAGTVNIPSGRLIVPAGDTLTIDSTGLLQGAGSLYAEPSAPAAPPFAPGIVVANNGTIKLGLVADNILVTGNNYTLTFDSNSVDATPAISTAHVYAATLAKAGVTFPSPVRAGFSLRGWNSVANGSGATLTTSSTLSDGKAFYAQWGIPKFVLFANDGDFIAGTTHSLTVIGESLTGVVLGDYTANATFASSNVGDHFTGASVTFGAAGHRTITATSTLDSSVTATLSVTVGVGSLTSIAFVSPVSAVMVGSTQVFAVTGSDSHANSTGSVAAVLTSSSTLDVVVGNTIRFGSVGVRTITATSGAFTTTTSVGVSQGSFGSPTVSITGTRSYAHTLTAVIVATPVTGEKITYQWYRGSSGISGATKSTHKITSTDLNHSMKVKVSFSATNYASTSVTSAAVSIPKDTVSLTISVPATLSHTVTATITVTLNPGTSRIKPTGSLKLYVKGVAYKSLVVTSSTPAVWKLTLAINVKGSYAIYASYSGSSFYGSKSSSTKTLKIT